MNLNKNKFNVITLSLLLALATGIALRVYKIGFQSLWLDELTSILYATQSNPLAIVDRMSYKEDPTPPGYYLLLHFVERFWGSDVIVMRSVSVAAGILAIPMMYWVGSLLLSPAVGLLASVLLATSYMPVYYSQEARSYSLLLFLSLVSSFFFIKMHRSNSEKQWDNKNLFYFLLAAALTAYVHYFGLAFALFLGFCGILFALREKKRMSHAIFCLVAMLLIFDPWIPRMLEARNYSEANAWVEIPQLSRLWKTISHFFNRSIALPILFISGCTWLIYLCKVRWTKPRVSQCLGYFSERKSEIIFVVLWAVVPLGLTFVISQLGSSLYTERNLIVTLPAFYLLFAFMAKLILHKEQWVATFSLVLLCGNTAQLLYGQQYFTQSVKTQFRETASELLMPAPGFTSAPIVAFTKWGWDLDEQLEYFFKSEKSDTRVKLMVGLNRHRAELKDFISRPELVKLRFVSLDALPDGIRTDVAAVMEQVSVTAWNGIEVRYYQKKTFSPAN